MQYFASGCGLLLGGWLVLGFAIASGLHFRYGYPISSTLGASAGAGLLAWAAWGLLFSAAVTLRERFALRRAMAGEAPRDGAGAVAIGSLQAAGETLLAPFNGEECLVYDYKVVHDNGRKGKQRSLVTAFEGRALAPCTVASGHGYFRLLTVPELDAGTTASTGITRNAAQRYVEATEFLQDKLADELRRRWTDDDGAYRCDIARPAPLDADWSRARIEQHAVAPRAAVCVIGHFAAARRGFVPAPLWGRSTRIYQCDARQLLATLARSALWRVVWALVLAAAAGGVVWLFIEDYR